MIFGRILCGSYGRIRRRADGLADDNDVTICLMSCFPTILIRCFVFVDSLPSSSNSTDLEIWINSTRTMFSLHSCPRREVTRRPRESWSSLIPSASVTCCETGNSHDAVSTPVSSSLAALQQDGLSLEQRKALVQAELDKLDGESPCPSCLYTGIATCAGLSWYFTHIATDTSDLSKTATRKQQLAYYKIASQRRPYFLAISAGWICIGAYRWHLG
jgi:hypothetical protein